MDLDKIVLSVEAGIGGQLGHLALVFGLGAMLGRLVSDAGAATELPLHSLTNSEEKQFRPLSLLPHLSSESLCFLKWALFC